MESAAWFTPYLVYLALIFVTGLLGNSIVFIVYYCKFKPSTIRTFILAMGLCDLLINLFLIPVQEVFRIVKDLDLGPLCPLYKTVHGFLLLYSAIILVVVALNRYLKICRPTGRYPLISNIKMTLLVGAATAGLLSIPIAVLYGKQTVRHKDLNVTTITCFVKDEFVDTIYFTAYNAIIQTCFGIGFLVMAVSYGLIAWRLWQHRKLVKRMSGSRVGYGPQPHVTGVERSSADDSVQGCRHLETSNLGMTTESTLIKDTHGDNGQDVKPVEDRLSESVISPTGVVEGQGCDSGDAGLSTPTTDKIYDGDKVSSAQECRRHQTQPKSTATTGRKKTSVKKPPGAQDATRRATLMMFVLTVVYVVNYLPYLLVAAFFGGKEEREAEFWSSNMYHIASKSYYINSAINPLVYGLCSASFRRHCRHLLCRCKSSD